MAKSNILCLAVAAACAGPFAAAAAADSAAATPPSDVSAGQLSEVLVTAQKRSERVQEVPASMTVLSAESLAAQGVTGFSDYVTLVPSLSSFSQGAAGNGAVILRGLYTGSSQYSNTVGYYIDDVPFSATSPLSYGALLTLDPDLSDIDHLEVLKGPQATLYGASTLGGLIKVVTNKPDLNGNAFKASIDGSTMEGGGNGYGLSGTANIVLVPGTLALRVSGYDRETPGYNTNLTTGSKDGATANRRGAKFALGWQATESLNVQLTAMAQSLDVKGWNYEFIDLQTLQPLTGRYTYSLPADPTFDSTYEVYGATLTYDAGEIGTFTNSTGYAVYTAVNAADYDLFYGGFYRAIAPEPVPANAYLPLIFGPALKKFSEELRFASKRMGSAELLAGVFFTREQMLHPAVVNWAFPPGTAPIPGASGNPLTVDDKSSYKEYAGYGNLTWYFDDSVDATIGARYSHNTQELNACQSSFSPTLTCSRNDSSDSDVSWLATVRWRPTDHLNTYARVATSYRPGGPQLFQIPNVPASFKSDSLTNYEIGVKGDWLDRRVRADVAAFYMTWKDLQMSSTTPQGLLVLTNAAKATVKGLEIEAAAAPVDNLTLGATLAYTNATMDSVPASVTAATGAAAGDWLPCTPRFAATFTTDYRQPIGDALSASYGFTFRHQGKKWSDYPGNPLNTGQELPSYSTLDVRASLDWDRYQLQARVANAFDKHAIDTVVSQRVFGNPPAFASVIPRRTYTLSLSMSF